MPNETNFNAALSLGEAAHLVPKLNGRSIHNSTLWRWCRRGCKARNGAIVRLAHARVGGQITTTRAALDRFYAELAEADLQSFRERDSVTHAPHFHPAKPRQSRTRETALTQAKSALTAEGI